MAAHGSHVPGQLPRAVLFDALGTLVELDDPVGRPRARARGARRGGLRAGRDAGARGRDDLLPRALRRGGRRARAGRAARPLRRGAARGAALAGPRAAVRGGTRGAARRACTSARSTTPSRRSRALHDAGCSTGGRQQLGRLAPRRAARHRAGRARRRGADVGRGAASPSPIREIFARALERLGGVSAAEAHARRRRRRVGRARRPGRGECAAVLVDRGGR